MTLWLIIYEKFWPQTIGLERVICHLKSKVEGKKKLNIMNKSKNLHLRHIGWAKQPISALVSECVVIHLISMYFISHCLHSNVPVYTPLTTPTLCTVANVEGISPLQSHSFLNFFFLLSCHFPNSVAVIWILILGKPVSFGNLIVYLEETMVCVSKWISESPLAQLACARIGCKLTHYSNSSGRHEGFLLFHDNGIRFYLQCQWSMI